MMKIFYFVLASCCLCSCSYLHSINPFTQGGHSAHAKSDSGRESPFTLDVVDEVNDGERLHVLGSVSAATDWRLDQVIVKLTGVNHGSVVGLSYLPLANANSEKKGVIKAGEKYNFSLSVSAQQLTDYQLELLWGDEAKQYLAELAAKQPGTLELREIEIETSQGPCPQGECEITYKLNAQLYNGSNKTIEKVILGVAFVRLRSGEKLDLYRQMPQNEERLEVGSLHLAPKTSRPLRLNFDNPVSVKNLQSEEGDLKPVLRIISFEGDSK